MSPGRVQRRAPRAWIVNTARCAATRLMAKAKPIVAPPGNQKPPGTFCQFGNQDRGKEDLEVDPRDPGPEVEINDLPHVHLDLRQRPDQDQENGAGE